MKKTIAGIATAAIVAAGGVAAVGIGSGVAVAQEDATESTTETPRHTTMTEALSELVAEGVITQDQADAVEEKLAESFVGRRGHRGHGVGFGSDVLDELGLDAAEVREQLQAGSTLAEIIESAGGDVDAVIADAVAAAQERIQTAVDEGRIDQAEADEKLADIEQRITDRLNGDVSDFGERGFGRHGRGAGNGNGSGTGTGA